MDTKKVAQKIAKDLFTGPSKHYSHLSMDDAAQLGWCESAVANRIKAALDAELKKKKKS